jgi:hypothetical protein
VWLPAAERLLAASTEIWCPSVNAPLVRHLGEVRSIASTGLDLLEIPGAPVPGDLSDRLRAFDEIVTWYGTARVEFRAAILALNPRTRFLTAIPPEGCGLHAVDYYLQQAGCGPGATPRIPVNRREGGYALVHPFSGSARKNWPLADYRAVSSILSQRMDVVWCTGPEESLEASIRCAGLDQFLSLAAGARVFIGNDSGPAHAAVATGTPAVVLFGASDPRVWAPRGKSVQIHSFTASPGEIAEAALRV